MHYTNVLDKCSPVLISVHTGQEMHNTDIANQLDYDSHNFIELTYSENVNISNGTSTLETSCVNIKSDNLYGGVAENNSSGISFKNFISIENGKLSLGTRTSETDGSVNALYRRFSEDGNNISDHSKKLRISIAGFVDGTVSFNSKSYKNWIGYIDTEKSEKLSGKVSTLVNDNITDYEGNVIDAAGEENHTLYNIILNSELQNGTLYGPMDLTPPAVAKDIYCEDWISLLSGNITSDDLQEEILGVDKIVNGRADQLQLHFLDNELTYTESDDMHWISQVGWLHKNNTDVNNPDEKAKDITGGSRQFALQNRTSGGIRASSLYGSLSAFQFSKSSGDRTKKSFDTERYNQSVTLDSYYGSITPIPSDDNLYLTLHLKEEDRLNFRIVDNYYIYYDRSQNGYITDLAGNLLQSATLRSVEKTPPAFMLTVAPVDTDNLYLVFNKQINTQKISVNDIPKQFEIVTSSGNTDSLKIDESIPAKITINKDNGTSFTFKLNRKVTFDDLFKYQVRVKEPENLSPDPVTGALDYVTQIEDMQGNFMLSHSSHALSDFGVNVLNVIYAYDGREVTESVHSIGNDESSFALYDFSGEDSYTGRILENKDITVSTSVNESATEKITMHVDIAKNINSKQTASRYNENLEEHKRLWLPFVFRTFTEEKNNTSLSVNEAEETASSSDRSVRDYVIPNDPESADFSEDEIFNWKAGEEVQFLLEYDRTFDNDADVETEDIPLYLLRLQDKEKPESFDLWSFKLAGMLKQRGNVTILNNVINLNELEQVSLEVDVKSKGNLTITVMTLDGNIIDYLERGVVEAGIHTYQWNGTNRRNQLVSRGLYFIRVVGPGIEETRKVMCIKE